jgi:wyosine [tRNA(Phe)-imidazoG37] synthetase (radical SAM superfamily)
LLHAQRISTFLVCNAQHPRELAALRRVTQLYVSVDAAQRDELRRIGRPLHRDFWERFLCCMDILRRRRFRQRTVFRLTLVKGFNMADVDGYADLVARARPCFVEIKGVTYCGASPAAAGASAKAGFSSAAGAAAGAASGTGGASGASGGTGSGLSMANVPFHAEVTAFAVALNRALKERLGVGGDDDEADAADAADAADDAEDASNAGAAGAAGNAGAKEIGEISGTKNTTQQQQQQQQQQQLLPRRRRQRRHAREKGYGIAAEHAHSCCVLLASRRFRVAGQWRTMIDFERFFELLEQEQQQQQQQQQQGQKRPATPTPPPSSAPSTSPSSPPLASSPSPPPPSSYARAGREACVVDGGKGRKKAQRQDKYGWDDGDEDEDEDDQDEDGYTYTFAPEDYMGAPTPPWALFGNGGFDPADERVYTKGKNRTRAAASGGGGGGGGGGAGGGGG